MPVMGMLDGKVAILTGLHPSLTMSQDTYWKSRAAGRFEKDVYYIACMRRNRNDDRDTAIWSKRPHEHTHYFWRRITWLGHTGRSGSHTGSVAAIRGQPHRCGIQLWRCRIAHCALVGPTSRTFLPGDQGRCAHSERGERGTAAFPRAYAR